MLYGATSEAFVASSTDQSMGQPSSGASLTLGGTDATFMLTFQLPAMPPSGGTTLLHLSQYSSNGTTQSSSSSDIYVTAISVGAAAMFSGPGLPGASSTTSANNISGYVSVDMWYTAISSVANTTTTVNTGDTMGPPPMLFVPKLFGGSWVTVAVSVSSTSNITVFARDSVLSSNMSIGASAVVLPAPWVLSDANRNAPPQAYSRP